MYERVMFFIDGENFVCRYQEMLSKGYKPVGSTKHKQDIYVWNSGLIRHDIGNIIRINYYTSAQGDETKIDSVSDDIKNIEYHYHSQPLRGGIQYGDTRQQRFKGHMVPHVFKKESKKMRSRLVDISITIDMLNFASPNILDAVYLISGDGDFIPLIKEVMRRGVKVRLMALSSGLNPKLRISGDDFECIDSKLFKEVKNK